MFRFGIANWEVHDMSSPFTVARTRLTVRFVLWEVVSRDLRDS